MPMATRKSLFHPFARGTGHALKVAATALSAGAATISILSFGRAHGYTLPWDRASASTTAVASGRAVAGWLGITPANDTVRAIGDTLQLIATLKDEHGALIPGVTPTWNSDAPNIAAVDSAGTVVTRGEGTAEIVVAAGGKIARARVVVEPRVAAVEILFDSTFRVPEGERRTALAVARDGRGHRLSGHAAAWVSSDTTVATVDSLGAVRGRNPGRTMIEARMEGNTGRIEIEVAPVPGSATILGGGGQHGDAGVALADPVVIQVFSRGGRPIAGVPVHFAADAGAGGTTTQTDLSDAQGKARATWQLGALPGRQRLLVSIPGLDSALAVTAEADPVNANTRIIVNMAGSGVVGDSLPPVTARVSDSVGTALSDVPITFSVLDGGKVVALATRTDSLGEARAAWRLGTRAGLQRLRVQVGTPKQVEPYIAKALVLSGSPAAAGVNAGDGQAGSVAAPLKQPVVLRVVDRYGNRVSGARLAVHAESGKVSDSTLVTDSVGLAKLKWTLGETAGAQRLDVKLAGTDKALVVKASARALGPGRVTFASPPASGTAGKPLAQPLRVLVTDVHGNVLGGQSVTFVASVGKVGPATVKTDAKGAAAARWTLGSKPGVQRLVAAVKGSTARDTLVIKAAAVRP